MFSSKSSRQVRFVRIAFKSDLKPVVVNWLLNREIFTSKEREKESSFVYSFKGLNRSDKGVYQ